MHKGCKQKPLSFHGGLIGGHGGGIHKDVDARYQDLHIFMSMYSQYYLCMIARSMDYLQTSFQPTQ